MKQRIKYSLIMVLFMSFSLQSFSQSIEETIKPVTQTVVIKNATIITKPGTLIENASIVIKNGVIKSVGSNVRIPKNAKVLEADSLYVYPGFIDGLGHIAIPKPKEDPDAKRPKSPGMATHAQAGITPELRASSIISSTDKTIAEWRKMGFTSAHTVPKGKMLPGTGAIILLKGSSSEEMILKDESSLFAQLQGGGRGASPSTVIGVITKYKELYLQAKQAKKHESMFASNSLGASRPVYDKALKAFYPVIDKKYPVFFKAPNPLDIQRVLKLQKELGFPVVLTGVKNGAMVSSKIKSINASVLMSIDLPDEIKKKKEADKKDDEKEEAKEEEKEEEKEEVSEEVKEMTERKNKAIKDAESQLMQMQQQGIQTAFSSMGGKSKDFYKNLKRMHDAGASEELILSSLTTTPAKLLGVSNLMGSLENGKMGNLIVSNKPFLEKDAKLKYVIIEGEVFEYEIKKEKKKGSKGAVADDETLGALLGTWEYVVDAPDGERKGTLRFAGTADALEGFISSEDIGEEEEVDDLEYAGGEVSFSFEIEMGPQTATINVTGTIDEDDMTGQMAVGQFGSFPINATKVSPE